MGTFPTLCGITGIPIEDNDPVQAMFLTKVDRQSRLMSNTKVEPAHNYAPFSLSFPAVYNEVGGILSFPSNNDPIMQPILNEEYMLHPYGKDKCKYTLSLDNTNELLEYMNREELFNYREGFPLLKHDPVPYSISLFLMHKEAYEYAISIYTTLKNGVDYVVNSFYTRMMQAKEMHNDKEFFIKHEIIKMNYDRKITTLDQLDKLNKISNPDARYSDFDEFAVRLAFQTCISLLVSDNPEKEMMIKKILTSCINDICLNDYMSLLGLSYDLNSKGNRLGYNCTFKEHLNFSKKMLIKKEKEKWNE